MDTVIRALKTKHQTIEELSAKCKVPKQKVKEVLKDLKLRGYLLERLGNKWGIGSEPIKRPATNIPKGLEYMSDADNQFQFGIIGDTHLGSKYERLDVLNELFDIFEIEGITRVYHQGNWIEGECRFNKHDIHTHGLDDQCHYFAKHYPQRPGITTYAITGDDHEGWWAHNEGIDVGARLQNIMEEAGRTDWVNMGYMEAFIPLVNANTRKTKYMLSMHPGGGSAYAFSYKPQKIVESLSGGEKPSVLLIGHYHKMSYNLVRGVHTMQTGCTQDQTPFMRKKGIDAHVGGAICKLSQDPKTGAIHRCVYDSLHYYNKGYYNRRWGYGGKIALPERVNVT